RNNQGSFRPARAVTQIKAGADAFFRAANQPGAKTLFAATDQNGDGIVLYSIDGNGLPAQVGDPLVIEDDSGSGDPLKGSLLARLVSADFNGDGRDDLAVLNTLNANERVSIFLADGNGGFQSSGQGKGPD